MRGNELTALIRLNGKKRVNRRACIVAFSFRIAGLFL
jgi:hypothetical protein